VKKFLSVMAAIAVLVAWSGTAPAQCGSGRFFSGQNQCENGYFGGWRVIHSNYSPVYSHSSFGSCSSGGYVTASQPVPQTVPYIENKGTNKAVMPDPNYQPYKGGNLPAPTPKKTSQPGDLPLPPKKIQPPNPRQDGFPEGTIQIDNQSYGRLLDGTYAKISDGTYSRLKGNTAYGSYSK